MWHEFLRGFFWGLGFFTAGTIVVVVLFAINQRYEAKFIKKVK